MPLVTEMTQDCQGILQVGSGVVTGEEFVQASYNALLLFQNTQNFRYEFVDLSNVTDVEFAEKHLAQITVHDRVIAKARPDAIVVVLAPREELYQVAKHWEQAVTPFGLKTHVARERAEALARVQQHLDSREKTPG
jgi:hypothetical protein